MRTCLLSMALLVLAGCDELSTQEGSVEILPITGRVVSTSGEPVSGAVVVAAVPWFAVAGSNAHEGAYHEQRGDLSIRDAVSDEHGRFVLSPALADAPHGALLSSSGVQIGVYAPGYTFIWLDDSGNRIEESFSTIPARIASSHDGETVRLEPASQQLSAHGAERIEAFVAGRGFIHPDNCRWQKTPALIAALSKAGNVALVKEIRGGCATAAADNASANGDTSPVGWRERDGQWQLVVDLRRLDTKPVRTTPAPFTGIFEIAFTGIEPDAGDKVLLENVMTGDRLVHDQPAPLRASRGDILQVRVLHLSRLMKQPPQVDAQAVRAGER